jgi:bifunctional non-homologous end joining protein LigD
MTLSQYNKKRNPESTSEPFTSSARHSTLHFVVQKHAASHLHYDFRLQVEGVLKSWAIPKGPSLNPAEKHLAIMVEDHPYEYRKFEGTIPTGNYGAGTVMVWDEGTYTPLDDKGEPIPEGSFLNELEKGKISFYLEGQKLKGRFSLIRMKNNPTNWLFVKAKDQYASTDNILKQDRSALSGRTMEEIDESPGFENHSKDTKKKGK